MEKVEVGIVWKNRPAVPNALSAPCQNCPNRTKPKTCEQTCEKWAEYKKQKDSLDQENRKKKTVTRMFIDMYDDARKKRER